MSSALGSCRGRASLANRIGSEQSDNQRATNHPWPQFVLRYRPSRRGLGENNCLSEIVRARNRAQPTAEGQQAA